MTFEPGCRNNWHIHHKAVQVLICVAGRGWYQEWGKPALALHKDAQEGASNEWLEPVTDDQYDEINKR